MLYLTSETLANSSAAAVQQREAAVPVTGVYSAPLAISAIIIITAAAAHGCEGRTVIHREGERENGPLDSQTQNLKRVSTFKQDLKGSSSAGAMAVTCVHMWPNGLYP
jgi:hypothetical protein